MLVSPKTLQGQPGPNAHGFQFFPTWAKQISWVVGSGVWSSLKAQPSCSRLRMSPAPALAGILVQSLEKVFCGWVPGRSGESLSLSAFPVFLLFH